MPCAVASFSRASSAAMTFSKSIYRRPIDVGTSTLSVRLPNTSIMRTNNEERFERFIIG